MNFLDAFLVATFLFFLGSFLGWCIEVIFRRCFTAKKWINPGFLTGPYLPLYGFGTVGLFAISKIPIHTGYGWLDALLVILIMGAVMTLIEYIAGLIFIKGMKIKLWDYSNRWGNLQGIICPLFSLFWVLVAAFYYFVIDPYVIDSIVWFVNHIEFAFVVGIFFGVFFVDFGHAINLSAKIRAFAKKHNTVIALEKLKAHVKDRTEKTEKKKVSFLFPLKTKKGLNDELENYTQSEAEEETEAQSEPQAEEGVREEPNVKPENEE
ncbi:MAG: hypothetical protein K2G44_03285 [Clostridia bacterium]|nr:hypothetical protein [Clostridia bacterium]